MQIIYDKEYEFEITVPKNTKEYKLELSLDIDGIYVNIPINKNDNGKYNWKIPSNINNLIKSDIECKIFFFYKNSRFLIHTENITMIDGNKSIINENIKINNEKSTKNIELNLDFSIKNKIDLKTLIEDKNYLKNKMEFKIKKILENLQIKE